MRTDVRRCRLQMASVHVGLQNPRLRAGQCLQESKRARKEIIQRRIQHTQLKGPDTQRVVLRGDVQCMVHVGARNNASAPAHGGVHRNESTMLRERLACTAEGASGIAADEERKRPRASEGALRWACGGEKVLYCEHGMLVRWRRTKARIQCTQNRRREGTGWAGRGGARKRRRRQAGHCEALSSAVEGLATEIARREPARVCGRMGGRGRRGAADEWRGGRGGRECWMSMSNVGACESNGEIRQAKE